jgi:hypothetical protein
MSGGHWQYGSHEIDEMADDYNPSGKTHAILAAVARSEHVIDWAICGDTGREDAKEELFTLWESTFDRIYGDE